MSPGLTQATSFLFPIPLPNWSEPLAEKPQWRKNWHWPDDNYDPIKDVVRVLDVAEEAKGKEFQEHLQGKHACEDDVTDLQGVGQLIWLWGKKATWSNRYTEEMAKGWYVPPALGFMLMMYKRYIFLYSFRRAMETDRYLRETADKPHGRSLWVLLETQNPSPFLEQLQNNCAQYMGPKP